MPKDVLLDQITVESDEDIVDVIDFAAHHLAEARSAVGAEGCSVRENLMHAKARIDQLLYWYNSREFTAGRRYVATFTPQAWVNDQAIGVDCEGPNEFDVTADITARGHIPPDDSYESDELRLSDNAPAWVKDWSGPFYVTVEERNG